MAYIIISCHSLGPCLPGRDDSALFAKAIACSNDGDLRGALAGFSELLHRSPGHADAAFNVTALLQMAGHSALAVHYIARVS
jgi:hypothetical protein